MGIFAVANSLINSPTVQFNWESVNEFWGLPYLTCTTVLGILVICWYYLFWKPLDWFCDLDELGYDEINTSKARYNISGKREAINALMRRRRLGDMPPVYPNGWFQILESDDLSTNSVKEVNVLGLNLVAWRGESRKSYVADAYCPHLGAHLGAGGKVHGECIQCPFHGWNFSGCNGFLENIPYSYAGSKTAGLKMWTTIEGNGFIYLWYHAEGETPSWTPHIYPEIASGELIYRGRSELHSACHIQDVYENGADLTHFNILHDRWLSELCGMRLGSSRLSPEIVKHVFRNASWRPSEIQNEKHIAVLEFRHELHLFGKFQCITVDVFAKQTGPATVILEFQTNIGRGLLFLMVTPLGPMHQRITHRFYTVKSFIHPIAKFLLLGDTFMIARDVKVWNRKTFVKSPPLTKEEGVIKQFRRWYSQFYSEKSERCYFERNEKELF